MSTLPETALVDSFCPGFKPPTRKRRAIRRYMRLDAKVAALGGEKTERWDLDDA